MIQLSYFALLKSKAKRVGNNNFHKPNDIEEHNQQNPDSKIQIWDQKS